MDNIEVRLARMQDFDGVKELLAAYHVNTIAPEDKKDGFVTTNLTDEQLENLIVKERGLIVAVTGQGRVAGFAMAASWDYWGEWPLFAYMIEHPHEYTLDGVMFDAKNTYQYGPVCLDKSLRGNGLFEKMFYASLESMRERYPVMVTFINHINPRSYAAHTRKVKTTDMGTFQFNNNNYHLMACPTTLSPDA